jgi:hypothetical protein
MRLLCAIAVLAIVSSQCVAGQVSKNVKVYWIPPEVETYTPVTAENIEKVASKIVDIKNENQANESIGLIQESNERVDSNRIRVKIVIEGNFYNFDSNGIGVSSAGEAFKIDLKRLKLVLCE